MQLLLLPILTSRQPPLLFGDPRLLQFAPGSQIDPIAPAIQHPVPPPPPPPPGDGDEGCKLLDSFAIVVQVSLATTALLTLVYKRWRERPQRPVPIWALDVSKQFIGAGVIHFLNLLVSYIVGRPVHGPPTNLCVWYFLNVFIDTTVGVAILWFWLHALQWVLQKLFHLRYIRTGHYGPPPLRRQLGPWAQQTAVFVISEGLMKLCVLGIFRLCPFLFGFGKWVLQWTRGNYRYQVVFVMFIFPLIMNAIQFWIVDTIVKVTPSLVDSTKPSPASCTYPDQERTASHDQAAASSLGDTAISVPNIDERTPLLESTNDRRAASV